MPVSSQSTRIFKQEDPVMETDLSLLAKVNEYSENKFDEGEKNLQDEINNWSMLANVAKPQDRDYINGKLNNLVGNIKNMGGVNLADPNSVNQLKSMGYNLYADEKIMQPVIATRKMNALAQDIHNKTNGKNAKDYDSVYGEYQMNKYKAWLNDGQQGTGFDGPTELPKGSFDEYSAKIQKSLKELKPDINDAPQNDKDKALNYYQVADKFIRKDRVYSAIDAITSSQDKDILTAHAWKGMQNLPDDYLVNMQANNYKSKLTEQQNQYNELNNNLALTNDFNQKLLYKQQLSQFYNDEGSGTIQTITKQLQSLPQGPLDENTRGALRDNLFTDALKEDYANSFAYSQQKKDLKMNQAQAFEQKFNQHAFEFGKMYDIKQKELTLKEQSEALKEGISIAKLQGIYGKTPGQLGQMGINGPSQTALMSTVPNNGEKDATHLSNDVVNQADAAYISAANGYYTHGYNYLMSKDPNLYGTWLKQDQDGNWTPKDAGKSTDVVNKALNSGLEMYSNIALMSPTEREGMKLSDDDLNMLKSSADLKQATLFKQQMGQLRDKVFQDAGLDAPSTKPIEIKLKNGQVYKSTYADLKEMKDRNDPMIEQLRQQSASEPMSSQSRKDIEQARKDIFKNPADEHDKSKQQEFAAKVAKIDSRFDNITNVFKDVAGFFGAKTTSVDDALGNVDSYYNQSGVADAWKKQSVDFNPYASYVQLPKGKNGKPIDGRMPKFLAGEVAAQHPELKDGVQEDDIDLEKVVPVFDVKSNSDNKIKYLATVRYQKGGGTDKEGQATKGDKSVDIDITNEVLREHGEGGGFFSNLYADDNSQMVYGMLLNKEGKTPLDPKDNYASALQTTSNGLLTTKYQIAKIPNKQNGVAGYRVNMLVPLGKDKNGVPKFQTMPVVNLDKVTTDPKSLTYDFPSNIKAIQDFMNEHFESGEKKREFYRMHGIPYPSDGSLVQPIQNQ